MTTPQPASDQPSTRPAADVDVLIVGAGVTGIYQLYRAIGDGFTAQLWEAGDGVGGTWYWNRYPGARFDSESYTYAYLFSRELFDEWEWQERFAEQPETERYFNHVVDRFDLRRHIRFGAAVTSAEFDEPSGTWKVTTRDGTEIRARYLIAATGILSVPFYPDVPGRQDFRGHVDPHRTVAIDAGRRRREAGRRDRHRIEWRPGDTGDRRRRGRPHGLSTLGQLVYPAQQCAHLPRRTTATQG